MSFNALILAGSRGGPDPLAEHAGVTDKALIDIAGTTMLARVVTALRGAGASRIAVSANSTAVAAAAGTLGVEMVAAEAGPSASAYRSARDCGTTRRGLASSAARTASGRFTSASGVEVVTLISGPPRDRGRGERCRGVRSRQLLRRGGPVAAVAVRAPALAMPFH